jgi:threonine synthase
MYFEQQFPPDYNISPKQDLINTPVYVHPEDLDKVPASGRPLAGEALDRFVKRVAAEIAGMLELKKV